MQWRKHYHIRICTAVPHLLCSQFDSSVSTSWSYMHPKRTDVLLLSLLLRLIIIDTVDSVREFRIENTLNSHACIHSISKHILYSETLNKVIVVIPLNVYCLSFLQNLSRVTRIVKSIYRIICNFYRCQFSRLPPTHVKQPKSKQTWQPRAWYKSQNQVLKHHSHWS